MSRVADGRDVRPEDLDEPILLKSDIAELKEPYEIKTFIPCCIVGCHQQHKRGWIVVLRNGSLSRVGKDCGKRLLGSDDFVLMEREFQKRRLRAARQRFISSPAFDPEVALAALRSWNERERAMERIRQRLGEALLQDLAEAVERDHGVIEIFDKWGRSTGRIRIYGGEFLTSHWQRLFADAKITIQRIGRLLRDDDLSDDQMERIVRGASEAQRKLGIVAKVIEDFDKFCDPRNVRKIAAALEMTLDAPPPFGPLDRSPIDMLAPGAPLPAKKAS